MGKGRTTGKPRSGRTGKETGARRPRGQKTDTRSGAKRGNSDFSDFSSSGVPLSFVPQADPEQSFSSLSEEDASLASLLAGTLRQANRPLSMDELLRITDLPRRFKRRMEHVLFSLQEQGLALKGPTGWSSPSRLRQVEGALSVQRSGMGFVTPAGNASQQIYIAPHAMNGAWHGDRVRVLVLPGKRGPSPEGRIIEVVERTERELAATALKAQKDGRWVCAPADARLQALFIVDTSGLEREVREKDLLLLRPGGQVGPNLWEAEATVNLEREENPVAQERLVKSSHGIPTAFPPGVLAQAGEYPPDPSEQDFAHRRRLEDHVFVTIDGKHAKDFDDAIQVERVEKQAEGYRLRVAIADVSHYVRRDSLLDAEARLRGNSYYFPLSVEPMLPEALSNGLCSLRPGVPRLVMVADMRFSGKGERLSADFYPAVIKSKARLTYGQIERALVLDQEEEQERLLAVLPMLREAEALAVEIMAVRRARGSLDFEIPEAEMLFDEEGNITGMVPRRRHFGHRMIEEFMIAANEAVAEYLQQRGEGCLFRVHEAPDPDKISTLMKYLAQKGLLEDIPALAAALRKKKKAPSVAELAALLAGVKGKAQEYTINRLLLRAMMQARYQPDNDGHFGLASVCYCHFTSPIRRYADLVTHRGLKHALGLSETAGQGDADKAEKPYTRSRLTAIADHINECERKAVGAEREIHKRLSILLLKDRVGERFDGIISGISDFGMFVELPSVMAEGMVLLSSLKDDFYEYSADRQELRGTGSGRCFRLGQSVSVILVWVHLGRLEVTLELFEAQSAKRKSYGKKFSGRM